MALIFSLLIRSVIRTSNGMTGMISYLADLGAQKDGEDASIASFSAGVGQCRALCVHIYIYICIFLRFLFASDYVSLTFFLFLLSLLFLFRFCFCATCAQKSIYLSISFSLFYQTIPFDIYELKHGLHQVYVYIYIYVYGARNMCSYA